MIFQPRKKTNSSEDRCLRSKHLSKCFRWHFDGAHGVVPSGAGSLAACSRQKSIISHHTATKKHHRNISIFRNVEISYLPGRGPAVVGEEGIYGSGGVGSSGARGVCACRPHHGRSNDMRLEEFGLHLRELEVIEICARWGVFPMYSEFSLFAASP